MTLDDQSFNAWLDAELRAVPLPPGMLERLGQIPIESDRDLHAAIRDVPVPLTLRPRLERIGESQAWRARLRQMALAASLVVAIGTAYMGAMIAFLFAAYPSPGLIQPRLVSRTTIEVLPQPESVGPGVHGVEVAAVDEARPERLPPPPEPPRPEFRLAAYRPPGYSPLCETRDRFMGFFNPAGWDPLEDRTLAGWPVFAAPSRRHELPELRGVPGIERRGVAIPLVPGVDAAFLIQTGFNPFVLPAADSRLETSVVPLCVGRESYDLARRWIQRGKRPSASLLRTEELLAAVACDFPEPRDRPLALYVTGGPSPFSAGDRPGAIAERRLVQVGVQARNLPDADRPGTHLTLALDVSASMGESDKLETIQRVLRDPQTWMGTNDRVSLVTFSEDACVEVEDVGDRDGDTLEAAADSLAADGSTNLVAGLKQAYAVAYRHLGDGEPKSRVVVLTDSLGQLDLGTANQIAMRLAGPIARGIRLHAIDVGDPSRVEVEETPLAHLAKKGGGSVRRASRPDQICWALRELVTGRSQRVAAGVRLEVHFNPGSVLAYRLLGHELGDAPSDPEADFYAGQSATALYEVVLGRNREAEVLAATVTWRDPATGRADSATQGLRRGQVADYLADTPGSFQSAAVVAEAAEILRGSPFVLPRAYPWSLGPAIQRAVQIEPRLRQRPMFAEFLRLIEQAETIRPRQSGGRG